MDKVSHDLDVSCAIWAFSHRHLCSLKDTFLMPQPDRLALAYVEGEEIECDARQPFFMPAVIQRVHPNSTYEVRFFHGEVIHTVLKSNIR